MCAGVSAMLPSVTVGEGHRPRLPAKREAAAESAEREFLERKCLLFGQTNLFGQHMRFPDVSKFKILSTAKLEGVNASS